MSSPRTGPPQGGLKGRGCSGGNRPVRGGGRAAVDQPVFRREEGTGPAASGCDPRVHRIPHNGAAVSAVLGGKAGPLHRG